MSDAIIKQADILRTLQKANPTMRRAIIKHSDKNLIRSICECAENCISGRVKLQPSQKSRLARHKHMLRKIVKKGDTWQKKKEFFKREDL
jgi:prephenate dehydrogenase